MREARSSSAPPFYKLCNLSRLYSNGQPYKWPPLSLSDRPSPRLMPPISESTRLVLEDLNLPFFDPPPKDSDTDLDAEVTVSLLSTRLGWSISSTYQIPVPGVLKERSNSSHLPLPDLLPLQAYEREDGPSMNMLPTEYPELQLFGRIDHDTQRFTFASLVLSRDWEPFRQISTYEPLGVSPDSNMTTTQKYDFQSANGPLSAKVLARSISPTEMKELQCISVRSSTLLHPRTRSQWEAIQSLRIHPLEWRIDNSSKIVQRDERRQAGNIDYNQASSDKDSWPQSSVPKLSTYGAPLFYAYADGFDRYGASGASGASDESVESVYSYVSGSKVDEQETLTIPMELPTRYQLGNLIANIMTCSQLPVLCNVVVEPPRIMRCSNRPITLSLASLVPPQELNWEREQLPVLFTAQHCAKGNEKHATAQMAYALHQTLLTLVLYYLDTRKTLDEQLPSWMVVYGLIYHEEGFSIQAHFPVFHFSSVDTGEWTPRTFGWAFYSVPVQINMHSPFSPLSKSRLTEIATLLRLQSHARYLLSRLQEWTGYKRTLRVLYERSSET